MNSNRQLLLIATSLFLAASTAASQTVGAKKAPTNEVEVSFANGSLVRMTLLSEKIEIGTDYGKLSVPVRDVRRIDFGLHLAEGVAEKIAAAIKNLGAADFKQRENAVRELLAQGAGAYPHLVQAAKSKDLEVAKRAADALTKLKAKVPAKELLLGDDDKIVTARFTIVGRILVGSLKAKCEYFGESELLLTHLRHLRAIGAARDADIVVDAAKYSSGNQWLDTGVNLEAAATLTVGASGEIDLRPSLPGNYVCGPKGYTRTTALKMKKLDGPVRAFPGTLLGRIGESGETFVIGDRFEGPADRAGKLYLQIMQSPYDANASGTYQVKVGVQE